MDIWEENGDEDNAGWDVNKNGAHLDALRSLKYLMCFCSISSRMAGSIFSDAFMQNREMSWPTVDVWL